FFIAGMVMDLPSESVVATGVMDSVPQSALDYLAKERPEAIDLLNQVQNGVAYYMIIPLLLVIALAVAGVNTFACIGSGIVSAYLLGIPAGTTSFAGGGLQEYLDMCMAGFADAGSWVIVMMMWVAAFGGLMGKMKALEPLSRLIVKISHNVGQLMFCNGLLCFACTAILSDELS